VAYFFMLYSIDTPSVPVIITEAGCYLLGFASIFFLVRMWEISAK
jgi:hypothetical protein